MNDSNKKLCLIVIDSGFSSQSMQGLNVLAVRDLARGTSNTGAPFLSVSDLDTFACDSLNHGSIVMERLRAALAQEEIEVSSVAFILLRIFGEQNACIRTVWNDGKIVVDGWTEAYLWSVALCKSLGYNTVANCSFGGIVHAADGTGWEHHQLSQATGRGERGHIVVAASGPGDGRAVHASWSAQPACPLIVHARQSYSTSYNFWLGASHESWCLTVRRFDEVVAVHHGAGIPANMWNQRQQLMFEVEGDGDVSFEFDLGAECTSSIRCDVWVRGDDSARFGDHVDSRLIAEPACFEEVIATGLRHKSYSPNQEVRGEKPDVLLDGEGEISFRTPEITARVAHILLLNDSFDVEGVKQELYKMYPKS